MMCCNSCPFNPGNCNSAPKCDNPICQQEHSHCREKLCAKDLGTRCFMDYYVINHLFQQDELAEGLVMESLRTAVLGRDRGLLLALFQAASREIKLTMWNWLEENEPRSLWMLNPIFETNGLELLKSFNETGSKRDKYLDAIASDQYFGRHMKPVYLI